MNKVYPAAKAFSISASSLFPERYVLGNQIRPSMVLREFKIDGVGNNSLNHLQH